MPITTIISNLEPSQIVAAVFIAAFLWMGMAGFFMAAIHGESLHRRAERRRRAERSETRAAVLAEEQEAQVEEKELASA